MNNDRFKFRVWDFPTDNNTSWKNKYTYFDLMEMDDDEWSSINNQHQILEQCTGLKDKNGTLGYHKDRYINEFGVECVIEWDKDKWVGKNETGIIYNIASGFDKCEIIGSIHEKESK